MKLLALLRSLNPVLFDRLRTRGDIDEELLSHIQLRADDLERSGLSRSVAERKARVEFGGYVKYKEQGHEAIGGQFFETLGQDVRFSVRKLRKSPGFTITAILTLALAIGANAVVFAVLNALILRPLNVPQAESLWGIEHGSDKNAGESYPDYLDLRDRTHSFETVAAYNIFQAGLNPGLATGESPAIVAGYEVSGNYFETLGIQPYLGRFFTASDEHGPNSAPYIVLSYDYWRNHFEAKGSVVGSVVQLNRHPFTILGVAPREFHGTLLFFFPDMWVPMVNQEQTLGTNVLNLRGKTSMLMAFGHLKPGVTQTQAIDDLNSVGSYLEKSYPKDDSHMTFSLARPGLAGDLLGPPAKGFLLGMTLLAGLILLAACANLGSLFAARAADRSREVALRLALGSSRRRILRQLFTEAILISILGGTVGLSGSLMLLRALSVWQPLSRYPIHVPVTPDAKVYVMALLLAVISGILFGLVPVRQVLQTDPYEVIKSGAGARAGKRITVRDVLLVFQIAICAVLVTSSMVAVRGLMRSLHSNFGFDPQNKMLVDTDLNMGGYSGQRLHDMQRDMIEAVETIPGVESVGMTNRPPLAEGWHTADVFTDATTDFSQSNVASEVTRYNVSPKYFDTASTALLSGRTFTWHDDANTPRVAVINREFARKIFGSVTSALGGFYKTVDGSRIQVVGVVEDGKYTSLTEDPQPAMFQPILQQPPAGETWLVVRSNIYKWPDPQLLATIINSKLRALDTGLVYTTQTWNKQLDSALFASRVATISLGVLGVLGAMLAITGIFGMAAYSVSKRLRELGIRIALGAQRREVLQAALGRSLKLLAFGSASGLGLGILAAKVLAFIVVQATPRDPLVVAGAIFVMLVLGLVATWIPAQRALSVDPLMLLREE